MRDRDGELAVTHAVERSKPGQSTADKADVPRSPVGFPAGHQMASAQLLALQRSAGNYATGLAITNQLSLQRGCGCNGTCGSCGPANSDPQQGEDPDQTAIQRVDAGGDSSALIVDDDAEDVGFTQMKKTDFVERTRSAVQAAVSVVPDVDAEAANAELDKRTQAARQQKAARIEADVKAQVPGAQFAPAAGAYIPMIAAFAAAKAASKEEGSDGGAAATSPPDAAPTVARQVDDGAPRLWSGWDGPLRLKGRDSDARPATKPAELQARMGEGSTLGGAQASMEAAFGTNFSSVRIHTDPAAARTADELGARAFTIGDHIAFGPGEYQPGTVYGDALLAHELAHTIQQRGSANPTTEAASVQPVADDVQAEEHDADHSAMRVVSRLWSGAADGAQSIAAALPRLRTGLRLRSCSKSKCCNVPAPTGPLKIVEPNRACEPMADERDNVFETAKSSTIYGQTGPSDRLALDFINKENVAADPNCPELAKSTATGDVPALTLSPFIYVKAGRYDNKSKRHVDADQCPPAAFKGKVDPRTKRKLVEVPVVEVISEKLADRIRAAEVEHCKDAHHAWRLTYGRYLAAVLELKDGFCIEGVDAGKAGLQTEYEKRLAARSGFQSAGSVHAAFECLVNLSADRDKRGWHTFKSPKPQLNPSCTAFESANTEADPYPNVDKHPSSELINGCGEPGDGADAG